MRALGIVFGAVVGDAVTDLLVVKEEDRLANWEVEKGKVGTLSQIRTASRTIVFARSSSSRS